MKYPEEEKKKKKPPHVKWMNDLINERAACSGRACRQENKCKPKCLFVFFSIMFSVRFYYCLIFPKWSRLNRTPGPVQARSAPGAPTQGFIGARPICLSRCLFLSLFVFIHISVRGLLECFLRLWQFSAWSPLICLSAYLLSEHSWFIYVYISWKWQRRIIFTLRGQTLHIRGCLFAEGGKKKNKKGVYFLVMYLWNGFARRREFDQIWSEVSFKKYDKCLWEDNQCSVNSITLATYC